ERWVEIWNNVFMQFNKQEDGKLTDLPNQNIDTGMGLERTVAVLNGFKSVYQTDAFANILQEISRHSDYQDLHLDPVGEKPEHNSMRIVADHIRSGVIMIGDGIAPSNVERGYILRRLLRRAIRHGRKLGINNNLCQSIAKIVIAEMGEAYPELRQKKDEILSALEAEEKQFRSTLEKGEREFLKIIERGMGQGSGGKILEGETAFDLYQTYGFPIEMTEEIAREHGYEVDIKGFEKAHEAHQQKSREGAAGRFAGGLSGEDLEAEKKLHTATHLMNAALKKYVGEHVHQKGAHINAERLRFDFTHEDKLDDETVAKIEQYVNEAIAADVEIGYTEMPVEEAKAKGAIGIFTDRYGEKVKVYQMGDHSLEICGGPHADRTGELGTFKIKKQENVGKGVRRIKAVLVGPEI
ncbi:MAG TPA: alanine--tRNA ligase-related protein, partial [Candidatus Gracilibacteria bacterium]